MKFDLTLKFSTAIEELLRKLLARLINLLSTITLEGGVFMFTVKADTPDANYSIGPVVAKDSEGNRLPDGEITVTLTSDNEAAVAVLADTAVSGKLHFGTPNADGSDATATLKLEYAHRGRILRSDAVVFTITHGDPVTVEGGGLVVPGITDVVEPAQPEPAPPEESTDPNS